MEDHQIEITVEPCTLMPWVVNTHHSGATKLRWPKTVLHDELLLTTLQQLIPWNRESLILNEESAYFTCHEGTCIEPCRKVRPLCTCRTGKLWRMNTSGVRGRRPMPLAWSSTSAATSQRPPSANQTYRVMKGSSSVGHWTSTCWPGISPGWSAAPRRPGNRFQNVQLFLALAVTKGLGMWNDYMWRSTHSRWLNPFKWSCFAHH